MSTGQLCVPPRTWRNNAALGVKRPTTPTDTPSMTTTAITCPRLQARRRRFEADRRIAESGLATTRQRLDRALHRLQRDLDEPHPPASER